MAGPVVTVPSMRPPTAPPAGLPAVPTVVEPCGAPPADVDPEELAVPAELVPGILEAFAAFPAPLGSLPELLRPPALPGPVTPLIAAVPAPAEPALGEAPLAAPEAPPADDAPPAEAPPDEEPPPDPPPPLCARADIGASRAVVRIILHKSDDDMGTLPFHANAMPNKAFRGGGTQTQLSSEHRRDRVAVNEAVRLADRDTQR
jgi:hypothetical protein